ncbi:MAG TPA: hypothetical protein VF324_00880 [Methanobacterium sp.]
MEENEIKDFVDNFKGMTWDELESMSREDMAAAILLLKVRFG